MFRTALSVFIFVVMAVLQPFVSAQQTSKGATCVNTLNDVHDLYKLGDGWDIGFIDNSRVLIKESELMTSIPDYSGVTETKLGLRSDVFHFAIIRFSACTRDASFEESSMIVDSVVAFKKKGRVFAYRIYGTPRELVKGEWFPCMCKTNMLVYDPDGSGKFSHMILYSPELPYLPAWVKSGPVTTQGGP